MIYLRENKPASTQFRSPRRQTLIGVIGTHTSESIMDTVGPDTGAENVAKFISTRLDPGSYHDIVDSDSIVQLVDYNDEAFHIATYTFNRRTTGLSFACRTTDWAKMSPERRTGFLRNGARAAARQARHHHATTGIVVPARQITLAQALAEEPGFLAHGHADPSRRSDPGTRSPHLFPWDEFFDHYRVEAADLLGTPTPPPGDDDMTPDQEAKLDRAINEAHAAGLRAQSAEAKLDRIIHHLNIDGHDTSGEGSYPVRTLQLAARAAKAAEALTAKD